MCPLVFTLITVVTVRRAKLARSVIMNRLCKGWNNSLKIILVMKTYSKWLESWKEHRLDSKVKFKKKIIKKYWVLSEINLILWKARSSNVRGSFWSFDLSSGISAPKNAQIFMKLKLHLGETYWLTFMALDLEKGF